METLNVKKAISDEIQTNSDFIVLYQYINDTSGRKARPCHISSRLISFALRGTIEARVLMADGSSIPIAYSEFDKIADKLGSRAVKGYCKRANQYGTVFCLEAIINLDCLTCVNVEAENYMMLGQDEEEYLFELNSEQSIEH